MIAAAKIKVELPGNAFEEEGEDLIRMLTSMAKIIKNLYDCLERDYPVPELFFVEMIEEMEVSSS